MNSAQGRHDPPADLHGRDAPCITGVHNHVIVRASAGSGKTYQLVVRYIQRLYQEGQADRLLATTFTRKAAGEILERVLLRLAEAALDESKCRGLASEIGDPAFDVSACRRLLREFGRQLHSVRISTLDSLFSRLATSASLNLGLPPEWEILDEQADARLRQQAVALVLQQEDTDSVVRLTKLLSKGESRRSVTSLVHDTIRHFYELYLETSAAAWSWFPEAAPPLSQSCLQEIVSELQEIEVPLPSWRKVIDLDCERLLDEDWQGFIKNGISAKVVAGEPAYRRRPIAGRIRECYERLAGHVRAIHVLQISQQTRSTYELLDRFHAAYTSLKYEARGMRFDDVSRRLAEAATGGESGLELPISHLMLDEFQDTSWTQWQVLRPLAERLTDRETGTSFFCVGDVKQAIYNWRGGMAELFDDIEDQLTGLSREPLNQSRRSAPPVIEAVNRLFDDLPRQADLGSGAASVARWCRGFETHTTARAEQPGYVRVVSVADDPEDQDRSVPATLRCAARHIAESVQRTPGRTVGVLLRKNDHVRQMIAQLRQLGVAASEEGGNPLTDSAAVQLLMSLLQLADHPGDTIARFHVAQSPLGPWLQFTDHEDDAGAELLASSIRRGLVERGYGQMFEEWGRQLAQRCSQRELSRLTQLIELAAVYDRRATLRVADFITYVEAERVKDPTGDPVQVMTIHSAKGLEFDVVVVPDLDWSWTKPAPRFAAARPQSAAPPDRVCVYRGAEVQALLPAEFAELFKQTRARRITEALCLLYVAVTRPVHELQLFVRERAKPPTMGGLVRAALCETAVPGAGSERVLYQTGDPDWFARCPGQGVVADEAPALSGPDVEGPVEIRFAAMDFGRKRGLARVAPSRAKTRRAVRVDKSLRSRKGRALQRGTLFHAWFEQIEWLDDGPPNSDELIRIAQRMETYLLDVGRCLEEFQAMLNVPGIATCLSRRAYQEESWWSTPEMIAGGLPGATILPVVLREQPVAVARQGTLLTGTIDRLVLLQHSEQAVAADILDYKTDRVSPEQLAEGGSLLDAYRSQLDAYAEAVSCIYKLPRHCIAARLLFVEVGEVVQM